MSSIIFEKWGAEPKSAGLGFLSASESHYLELKPKIQEEKNHIDKCVWLMHKQKYKDQKRFWNHFS